MKDKAEDFYIEKYGVCPAIEKEVALHSHKDMIQFATDFAHHLKEEKEKEFPHPYDIKNEGIAMSGLKYDEDDERSQQLAYQFGWDDCAKYMKEKLLPNTPEIKGGCKHDFGIPNTSEWKFCRKCNVRFKNF